MTAQTARRLVLTGLLLLTAGKFQLATQLALFGGEAFYWLCAQHPALHYADLPFINAALVGLGTAIAGDSTLGVRLVHLLFGLAVPLLVVAYARPLTGERDAWLAGGLALAVPGVAIAGSVAIPDVALMVWTLLFMTGIERGIRGTGAVPWIGAGLAAALGLATHVRFSIAIAAAAGFLLSTAIGRRSLRRPWPWVAAAISLVGLYPMLGNGFGRLQHLWNVQVVERHDTSLRVEELVAHIAEQMLIASPILYLLLLGILVTVVRQAVRGDHTAALHAWFAALPIGLFLFASPLHFASLETVHWPLVGYVALLPLAPGLLTGFATRGRWQKATAVAGPALGLAIGILTITGLSLDLTLTKSAARPFRGWPEAAAMVNSHIAELPKPQIVVADNFKVGANLAFYLGDDIELYVLNHYKNRKYGRQPQFPIWNMGEAALATRCGVPAFVVIDNDELPIAMRDEWFARVPSLFDTFELIDVTRVPEPGGKRTREFRLYRTSGALCPVENQ